ncbi:hypothetical protein [Actinophytocola sp.]|uniref:hypothetical protein n=1 Tax=Actinophytocola sp. TaxID=1872138 RepID=UPI003899FF43
MAVDNRLGGGGFQSASFHQAPGSRAVRKISPVEGQFSADDDVDALRAAMRQLVNDVDQQFDLHRSSIPE